MNTNPSHIAAQTPLSEHFTRGLYLLTLAMMLGHFFIYAYYSFSLMRFPFDYDQGEGFELVDTVYLSEGKSPYRDNETFPFYASNYPPVYHVVLIPFVWIFGADYWYGRLVAFIGTLVTAGAIGYAIYRAEKRRDIALLMGLAFLASNYIYHIGPLFRQHYFMVMFEVLAVVVLANLYDVAEERRSRRLWIGLFVLLLAGYTKQLAAITCAAVFLWLFIRNPRRAVLSGIGFASVAGVVFVILNMLTDGQWWINVVAANVNQYIVSQFTGLLRQFVRLHWTILFMAGLMAVYELYFTRLSLYTVWFVVTFVSTIGSGKWGAGDSYFATTLAAACILSGIFIARTLNRTWTFADNYISRGFQGILKPVKAQRIFQAGGIIGLLLMMVYGIMVVKLPTSGAIFEPVSETLGIAPKPGHRYPLYDAAGWTPGYATIGHLPTQQDIDNGWVIVDRIRASEKPVMSEEAGFSLQAGREVISNPTQLKNLYDNGDFDAASLVEMIENQGFGMVIFRARFYPEPVLAAVDNAYFPKEVIPMNGFNYELWYPEPTWTVRREIRNFLEGDSVDGLNLPLPEGMIDVEQWTVEMMARWTWLPELQADADIAADADSDCLSRVFVRREMQTTISICGDELRISSPAAMK
ncbi:MAG TPA: hypothetical protein VJZ27_17140 [Aggregatilineales bacterium]|nr:hypothetical protein [Aggregatilineales bacterium]